MKAYCSNYQLCVNINKTKIVIFRKGGHAKFEKFTPFLYANSQIEIVSQYIYLGIIFSNSTSFYNNFLAFVSKLNQAINSTINLVKPMNSNSWHVPNVLFESLIRSVFVYGAEIWCLRCIEKFEKIKTQYFKRILHLPGSTPNYTVRLEANRAPLAVQVIKQSFKWINKIIKMDDSRFPKICLLKLLQLSNSHPQEIKYNWMNQLKVILLRDNITTSWEDIPSLFNQCEANNLETYESNRRKNYLFKVNKSTSLLIDPFLDISLDPPLIFSVTWNHRFVI